MTKDSVIISRMWHNPAIRSFMTNKHVGSEMELDDFLKAVLAIVGSPTMLMTKKQLEDRVMAAKEQVLNEMKKATVHV